MPNIDDVNNHKKRFKKKAYRPWNLLDEPSSNLSSSTTAADSKDLDKQQLNGSKPQAKEFSTQTEPDNASSLAVVEIASRAIDHA